MKIITPTEVTDGGGTFSRASTATYFDASGTLKTAATNVLRQSYELDSGQWVSTGPLLEAATTNLLPNPEQFDNATWEKTNLTVSANASAAPNAVVAADKLIPSATNGEHFMEAPSITVTAGSPYTLSVFAKADGYSGLRLTMPGTGWVGDVQPYVDVDLSTGTVLATNAQASATPVGSGWYRVSLTATSA